MIFVKAKTGAKKPFVEKIDSNHFKVAVAAQPEKGKANEAIVKALADYFKIPPSNVILIRGETSKEKVFEISE